MVAVLMREPDPLRRMPHLPRSKGAAELRTGVHDHELAGLLAGDQVRVARGLDDVDREVLVVEDRFGEAHLLRDGRRGQEEEQHQDEGHGPRHGRVLRPRPWGCASRPAPRPGRGSGTRARRCRSPRTSSGSTNGLLQALRLAVSVHDLDLPGEDRLRADRADLLADHALDVHGPREAPAPVVIGGADHDRAARPVGSRLQALALRRREALDRAGGADVPQSVQRDVAVPVLHVEDGRPERLRSRASRPAGCSTFVGQMLMQASHLMQRARNVVLRDRAGRADEAALFALRDGSARLPRSRTASAEPAECRQRGAAGADGGAPRSARSRGGQEAGTRSPRRGQSSMQFMQTMHSLSPHLGLGLGGALAALRAEVAAVAACRGRGGCGRARSARRGPSSAPSGHRARQKNRGRQKLRQQEASTNSRPISHAPLEVRASRTGGCRRRPTRTQSRVDDREDGVGHGAREERDRVEQPDLQRAEQRGADHHGEDPVLQLVELAVAVALEALLRLRGGTRASA